MNEHSHAYPGTGLKGPDTDDAPVIHYTRRQNLYSYLDVERMRTSDNPVFFVEIGNKAQAFLFKRELYEMFPLHTSKTHDFLCDLEEDLDETTEYPLRLIAVVGDEDADREFVVTVALEEDMQEQAECAALRFLQATLLLEAKDEETKTLM